MYVPVVAPKIFAFFSMTGKYLRCDNWDTVIAAISGRLELRDCHNMMLPFAP